MASTTMIAPTKLSPIELEMLGGELDEESQIVMIDPDQI